MIEFNCMECGKHYRVKDTSAGKKAKCECGAAIVVPPNVIAAGMPIANYDDEDEGPGLRPVTWIMGAVALVMVVWLILHTLSGYRKYEAELKAIELYNKGIDAYKAKNDEEALASFVDCMKIRPKWADANLQAALLAVKLKKPEQKELLENLLEFEDEKVCVKSAYASLGYLALKKKEPDPVAAKKYLAKALKLDPKISQAAVMLAALAFNEKKYKECKKYLDIAAKNLTVLTPKARALCLRLRLRLAFESGEPDKFLAAATAARGEAQPESLWIEVDQMALDLFLRNPSVDKDNRLLPMAKKAMESLPEEEKQKVEKSFAALYFNSGDYNTAVGLMEKFEGEESSAITETLAAAHASLSKSETKAEVATAHAEKALGYNLKMINDPDTLKRKGLPLLLRTMGLCERLGKKEESLKLLEKGLVTFPEDAGLQRRKGYLLFKKRDFAGGLEHLEKSLSLDKSQKDLAEEIKGYRAKPVFDDFSPSRSSQFVARPLIHVRVASGSPFGIVKESIKLTLDGKPITQVMGGNECFYAVQKDLSAGKHVVKVTARDAVGNEGEAEFSFPVDTTPPDAKLLRPKGLTRKEKPLIAIRLFDSLTKVAANTVTVTLRNAEDNPNMMLATMIRNGIYSYSDEKLGYERGDALQDPEKVAFYPRTALKPGKYLINIRMKDVLDHERRMTLSFEVME